MVKPQTLYTYYTTITPEEAHTLIKLGEWKEKDLAQYIKYKIEEAEVRLLNIIR